MIIENSYVAGLVTGLPISALCMLYALLRKGHIVTQFKASDAGLASISDGAFLLMLLGGFAFVGPMLGILAGLVYKWVPSTSLYLILALGLAMLFSIAALLSRTPFTFEKIVLNFAVGLSFGFLLPRLMGS
jgi:hypothetical protein